jgi:hypothetical protein
MRLFTFQTIDSQATLPKLSLMNGYWQTPVFMAHWMPSQSPILQA